MKRLFSTYFTLFVVLSLAVLSGAACSTAETNRNSNAAVVGTIPTPAASASPTSTMSGMHGGMGGMQSSPDAEQAPYDLQFIDTMTAHHQGAIDMARMAETKAQHAELMTFA